MKRIYPAAFTSLLFFFLLNICRSQPVLSYENKMSGLSSPLDIVNAGDNTGRLFIVQRGGTIRVYNSSYALIGNFLTVTGINSGGEEGLLSMAFDPDYENPDPLIGGFFWVYYTNNSGNLELARYRVSADPNVADAGSRVVVLTIPHPTNSNHNGGKIIFGTDGYLYLSIGDGGGGGDVANNAQNGSVLLGKMLRIAVNKSAAAPYYTIPPDNPFVADPAVADEIWALGLRNTWRWSFDRVTGNMWLADVGQGAREEINVVPTPFTGGYNFGWRCYEGTQPYNTAGCLSYNNYYPPIFDYGHNNSTGGFSVTGGYVYRGPDWPVLTGYYICADFVSGNQWLIRQGSGGGYNIHMQPAAGLPGGISTFGEGENGMLYAASLNTGIVYKVNVSTVLPLRLIFFRAVRENDLTKLEWQTNGEINLSKFEIEYSFNGIDFQQAGTVDAVNNPFNTYLFDHLVKTNERLYYRLKIVDHDRRSQYSSILMVNTSDIHRNLVFPSLINDDYLRIRITKPIKLLEIYQANGIKVRSYNLENQTGTITLALNDLIPGLYFVRITDGTNIINQKIMVQ